MAASDQAVLFRAVFCRFTLLPDRQQTTACAKCLILIRNFSGHDYCIVLLSKLCLAQINIQESGTWSTFSKFSKP